MASKSTRFFISLFALALATELTFAQSVGVVMSGGGAKGIYHIGVLQALEENDIPIDFVAGTSMGSVLAAYYAAGYSPEQLREIALSGKVKEWVSGKIDSKYQLYYRQIQRPPSMLTLRFDSREEAESKNLVRRIKLQLPKHIISTTSIDLAFMEALAPATVAAGRDFDSLMVPFLCVASDMRHRRAVVMRSGDLGLAVRSSMSIPLAFSPVRLDSMLLYDGGVYNNFPWEPMLEDMKPDLIIGSACTSNAEADDKNLLDQVWLIGMEHTNYDLPSDKGFFIGRKVNVQVLDFSSLDKIIDAGYEDALKVIPQIKERVKRRVTQEEMAQKRLNFQSKCPELLFDKYEIEGLKSEQQQYVKDFMNVLDNRKQKSRQLSFDQFREKYYTVLSNGEFSASYPEATYNPDKFGYDITLKLETKPSMRLEFGGNLSSGMFNQIYFGLRYNLIRRQAHEFYGEFFFGPVYSGITIGGRTDFYASYPLYLDYYYNFQTSNYRQGTFSNLTRVKNTQQGRQTANFGSVGFGLPLTRKSMFVARINAGQEYYQYYLGGNRYACDADASLYNYFGGKVEIAYNTFDQPVFPSSGIDLRLSGIGIIGRDKSRIARNCQSYFNVQDESHTRGWVGAKLSIEQYFDVARTEWFSFGYNIEGVVTNHPSFNNTQSTEFSEPVYAPTMNSKLIYMPEFRARRYLAMGVIPTFKFAPKCFLRVGGYMMLSDKEQSNGSPFHQIFDASVVYNTPIGPLSLTFTKYGVSSWGNLYLMVNFGYFIFRPSGLFY